MLSFAELKFKWFFHVVGSVNQVHVIYPYLIFLHTVSHLKSMNNLYHGSEKCEN